MTFEKDSQVVEVDMKKAVIEFEDGTTAKIEGLQEIPLAMEKIAFLESKGYKTLVFDFM